MIPSTPDGPGSVASPPAPAGAVAERPEGRRPGWRWLLVAFLAGAAASTLATAMAAAVAGRQADLALQPVELALRVGLLLVAPCVGAVLAAMVVPRGGGRLAVAAVGVGVPVGPLLVLRLDRLREFGVATSLLVVGALVAWGAVGAALAAGWWSRPGRRVQRTDLPGLDPAQPAGPPPAGRAEPSVGQPAGGPPADRGEAGPARPVPGPPAAGPAGAPRAAAPDPAGSAPARLRRVPPPAGGDGDAGPGDPPGPGAA